MCPSHVNVAVVVWWETEGGDREIVCVIEYICVHGCMCVFEMHLHCVCPSLVNVRSYNCVGA